MRCSVGQGIFLRNSQQLSTGTCGAVLEARKTAFLRHSFDELGYVLLQLAMQL